MTSNPIMQCVTCGYQSPEGTKFCSACGSALDVSGTGIYTPFLPENTRLQNGAFAVGNVLGQGGFGITYRGGDMSLRRYVAIKEFFPQGSIRRNTTIHPDHTLNAEDFKKVKAAFIEEARTLARFSHPSIVRVFGVFEENNTAYMVMEFLEGQTLSKNIVEKAGLGEDEVVKIAVTIGEALAVIHEAGLIHRDLKPDNICLTKDGRAVLIDFGTARAFASGKTVKHTAMLTAGYAPLEQYSQHARFGAFTDIYALGATLYHALTGEVPPQATDIAHGVELKPLHLLNSHVSQNVSQAIMWAMQIKATDRPQNVKAFLDALNRMPSSSSALDVNTNSAFSIALPRETKLMSGNYMIGPVLGQGSLGITYKAGDMNLKRLVAIKEFFPQGAIRQNHIVSVDSSLNVVDYDLGKARFIEGAQKLARLLHPNIIRVYGVWEENHTAYIAMEFLEGKTLQKLIEEKGWVSESVAVAHIRLVAAALEVVHAANIIHRDIKPDNICITNDGRTVLIDFSIARSFVLGEIITHTQILTPGYAPLEQYGKQGRFGPASDVYALGATLYHALTGQLPPPATDRVNGSQLKPPHTVNPHISRGVSEAIMWTMQIKATDRPQTVRAFLSALDQQAFIAPKSTLPSSPTAPAPTTPAALTSVPATPQQSTVPLTIEEISSILGRPNQPKDIKVDFYQKKIQPMPVPMSRVVEVLSHILKEKGRKVIRYGAKQGYFLISALIEKDLGTWMGKSYCLVVFEVNESVIHTKYQMEENRVVHVVASGYTKGYARRGVAEKIDIPVIINEMNHYCSM